MTADRCGTAPAIRAGAVVCTIGVLRLGLETPGADGADFVFLTEAGSRHARTDEEATAAIGETVREISSRTAASVLAELGVPRRDPAQL